MVSSHTTFFLLRIGASPSSYRLIKRSAGQRIGELRMQKILIALLFVLLVGGSSSALAEPQASGLRLATFRADVTPPLGSPLCGGLVKPVAGVSEPLLALGVVILSDVAKPVVLC